MTTSFDFLYGPPVGTEIDLIVATCTHRGCVRGCVAGGAGCPQCARRLGEIHTYATPAALDAALIDRFDQLVRRSEDSVPLDATEVPS